MTSKHIRRDFSAFKKNVIRPTDEYVGIEIFSFDPKFTRTYLRETNTLNNSINTIGTSWKAWSCYASPNDNDMEFYIDYIVREVGDYRIDLIYEKSNHLHSKKEINTGANLSGEILIESNNGTVLNDNVLFEGENNVIKRKCIYSSLNEGKHKITITVPHNCYFMGVIIYKVLKFTANNQYGDTRNATVQKDNLMLNSATLTISDKTSPSELTAEIAYDNALECEDSASGFYIDYMDEVNYYVKDDDKQIQRVFGGYVSSVLPDDNHTKLSIHCADRLVDGQKKYVLDLIKMQGGSTKQSEDEYSDGMTKLFNSYPQALKYICTLHEITLNSNITNNYLVDGEKYKKGLILNYGKKKNIKSIPVTNGISTPSDNFIMIRNKPSSDKKQIWELYDAKKKAKTPPLLSNKPYMHITYGIGSPEVTHSKEITETVDVTDEIAGSQKFSKCGVSQDKKFVMGIGKNSAGAELGRYPYKNTYKSIFENKCPMCGKTGVLKWDCIKKQPETEITCSACLADFCSVTGYDKNGTLRSKLKKVGNTVKSSSSEQKKLKSGSMVAVAGTNVQITPDDIFKAITKIAFKYKYKLRNTTSSYSAMKKAGYGDCWAFSDLIFTELSKYGVSCKIVEYVTNESPAHRSVLYKNAKGKWVDFPYREYGWGTKYNNMLNNTSASKSAGYVKINKGKNIGSASAKGKSTTKKQKTTIKTTTGYNKEKPFQGYLQITYSVGQTASFKNKTKKLYIKFTHTASEKNSLNIANFPLYWINNTIKQTTLQRDNESFNLVNYIRDTQHIGETDNIYLHAIHMIAPKVLATSDNKDTDWYKVDKTNIDESSCKLKLYQITFDDNRSVNSSDVESCGKTVNEMLKQFVDDAGYLVDMSYGLHRCDDRINFRVNNNTTVAFTAREGNDNNILSWNSISYSPVSSLYNMSMYVFKDFNGQYKYVDTRSPDSVLRYHEQCTLKTTGDSISSEEAYYNARMNENFNPNESYTFTITVPNYPDLKLGDLVQVIANAKKLNTIKELQSIKIMYDKSKMPRVQTELGLGELAPDIQLNRNMRELRSNAKKESTAFGGSVIVENDENIYIWDR